MNKELKEATEWIKERIAYIAENCDLTDLDNKKVYDNFKTILNYMDNSISKEVIEKKLNYWNNRLKEDERLPWMLRDKAVINVLQELLEKK